MLFRALVIWCVLLAAAVANGALRVSLLIPRIGDVRGHLVSTMTLSLAIAAIAWLTIRWIAPANHRDAAIVGISWLALTVAFEFVAGHFVFGAAWHQLLADYNVFAGRIWILIPLTTAFAPLLAMRRGFLRGRQRAPGRRYNPRAR